VISALAPTVVINAAAWTDVDRAEYEPEAAHLVNALGALNVAMAAKMVGAIFVQISTDYVFSGNSDRPWQENDLRAPISVYGSSKAAGEVAVLRTYPDGSYIFRTAWLYSQWGKNFAKSMTALAILSNEEVPVVCDQIGQPTSALDLANQIIETILAQLPFGIYHATNSGQGSWFDFAQEVFRLCQADVSRILPISATEMVRPAARPRYSVLAHGAWSEIGTLSGKKIQLKPMRDWRIALADNIGPIIAFVQESKARQ
jgi:dTDP-4-dehydrorhamnose reductase